MRGLPTSSVIPRDESSSSFRTTRSRVARGTFKP